MKRVLTLILLIAFILPAYGQYRRKSKKSKTPFVENVWIGANLTDFRFSNRTFSMGVTPMAAYAVSDNVSLGAMIKMTYRYENIAATPPKIKFETFDVGPGLFARFDFLRQFFAQIEWEYAFEQRPVVDPISGYYIVENNKVVKERAQTNYAYIGAGYCSGADVKFCVSIHYNLLDDIYSIRPLWDYRFGFRWNLVPESEKQQSKRKR